MHLGKLEAAKILADGVAKDAGPDYLLSAHLKMLAEGMMLVIQAIQYDSEKQNEGSKDATVGD